MNKTMFIGIIASLIACIGFIIYADFRIKSYEENPPKTELTTWSQVEEAERVGEMCDAFVVAYLENYYGSSQQ